MVDMLYIRADKNSTELHGICLLPSFFGLLLDLLTARIDTSISNQDKLTTSSLKYFPARINMKNGYSLYFCCL